MFLLAVFDPVRLLDHDFRFGLFVLLKSVLFFFTDKLVHLEENVLDFIINFAVDLPYTVFLQPGDLSFE